MCGQNDDPTTYEYVDPVPTYPPTPKTEEEMEERLQFDDVVEDALWDMMREGLIE